MTLAVNRDQTQPTPNLPPPSNVNGWPILNLHSSQPYWIAQKKLAKNLAMSVDALRKMFKDDPNAPQAIKLGTARQAPVYYMLVDVEAWLMSKRAA